MDRALEQGHTVYVHDTNRNITELVLDCYFVNRGMSGTEALKEMDRIRQDSQERWRRAPAKESARRLVRKVFDETFFPTCRMPAIVYPLAVLILLTDASQRLRAKPIMFFTSVIWIILIQITQEMGNR